MYIPHRTQSPFRSFSGYVSPYDFPLPSLNGLGALSTGEIGLGVLALGAAWWFLKKRRR